MSKNCCCVYCKQEFSNHGIFTHVERTHIKSLKYSNGRNNSYSKIEYREKIKKSRENCFEKKLGKFKIFDVVCVCCKKIFQVEEREFQFPKKTKYFCSRRCSNFRMVSDETKQKISNSLQESNKKKVTKPKLTIVCKNCGISFETKKKKQKYCSKECSSILNSKIKRENRNKLINYRSVCSFKFSLNDFPDEFDFSLIESFGWYKPKNRGNNLFGISRDHMVSVVYGFKNGIDADVISHPANCQLLRHTDNVSKGIKNSITIEELYERIEKWNEKYNIPPI